MFSFDKIRYTVNINKTAHKKHIKFVQKGEK